jgi:hypothetical protein
MAIGTSKSRLCAVTALAAVTALVGACDKPSGAGPEAVPSGAGGTDQLAWQQFAATIAPSATAGKVVFETWASDQDIYVTNPCPVGASPTPGCNAPAWPTKFGADKPLQHSVLGRSHLGLARAGTALPQVIGPAQGCATPPGIGAGNAAANANFPASGCVGEEVRRDRATFDYMVGKSLWSKAGLKAYFGTGQAVAFPTGATQVKADWIPVATLATWLGKPASFVTANFYTASASVTPGGPQTAYAMTSLHVSVKTAQFPNWVWSNFENAYTPGRCDQTGCSDAFGAQVAQVPAGAQAWGQYGACAKSAAGAALLSSVKAPAVFANYCLTGSQTGYGTTAKPTLLGSPIIEPLNADVPLASSSCISCHAGASFNAAGPNFNVGQPIGPNAPPAGYRPYDFLWGLLGAN